MRRSPIFRNGDDRLRRLEREAAQSPDDAALAERLEAERARTEHGWLVEQRRSALLADLESFSLSLHNPRPNWLMLERLSGVMADFAGVSVDSVMQRFSAAAREFGREGMSLWGTERLTHEVGIQGLARAIADASNAQIRRYATVRDEVGRRTGQWPNPLRNADEARRRAERSKDPVEVLKQRVRRGEVTNAQVELAARLGDPRAMELTGPVKTLKRATKDAILAAGQMLGDERGLAVAFAADCAERVLSVFEEVRPDDGRPRAAINFARDWLAMRSNAANTPEFIDAATAAHDASEARAHDAAAAAMAACFAAGTARTTDYVTFASRAASDSVSAAIDSSVHHGLKKNPWRALRLRLAAYVLGDVLVPRPA